MIEAYIFAGIVVWVVCLMAVIYRQSRMIDRLTDQLLARNLPEFVQGQVNLSSEIKLPKRSDGERVLRKVDSVLGGIR